MSCFACFTKQSTPDYEATKSIEKQMKFAHQSHKKTFRILLLGPGSSGKSTILKQIKKIHHHCEDDELSDRHKITEDIQNAVIQYMQILCHNSTVLHQKHKENTKIHPRLHDTRDQIMALKTPCPFTPAIATKIQSLWSDEGIQFTFAKRHYFQIDDNVEYFFNRLQVLSAADYVPDFDDYLRFRQRTTGFVQTNIVINDGFGRHVFEFTDVGGQRSERKKWMRFIQEDINAVLYIVAISDYDLTLFEDNRANRLVEAIDLFRTIMTKGKFFTNKSVLIFFNKYDLFKEKIKKVPITVTFDDFPREEMNPNDADDVTRFVAGKFLRVFEEQKIELTSPLHIVRTTALNTKNIEKIMADITTDLVQQNLKTLHLMN